MTTVMETILDEIIDHCSLYRMATGLRVAVSDETGADISRALAERIPGLPPPTILREGVGAAGATDKFDLLITDPAAASAHRSIAFLDRLRDGALVVLLGAASPAHLRELEALSLHLLSTSTQSSSYLMLLRHPTPAMVAEPPDATVGIHVTQPVYGGILRPGKWTFPRGEWSLLVGRSGIGKTTLIELIAGLRKHRGAAPLSSESDVFYMPQDAQPIPGATVDTNISLFARSGEAVRTIIHRLNLSGIRHRTVNQSLSGGERQRVVIGQALASGAKTLLLDEPSAGLDQIRRAQVFYYLRSQADLAPATVLCVAHDFTPILEFFDHVYEVMAGVVVQHR